MSQSYHFGTSPKVLAVRNRLRLFTYSLNTNKYIRNMEQNNTQTLIKHVNVSVNSLIKCEQSQMTNHRSAAQHLFKTYTLMPLEICCFYRLVSYMYYFKCQENYRNHLVNLI